MRILMINDSITSYGGAENVLFETKKILEKNGNLVFLVGGKKYKENLFSFFGRWFSLRYYLKTKNIIKKNKIDIVHIHNCNSIVSLSPAVAAKRMNKNVIMTLHSLYLYCPKSSGLCKNNNPCLRGYGTRCLFSDCVIWYKIKNIPFSVFVKWLKVGFTRYIVKKYVDYFLCPSKELKQNIKKSLKLPDDKIIYLPNFIEINKYSEKNFDSKKDNQFLFVGRISGEKGIDVAIKAVDVLVNKYNFNDIKLKIIGEGEKEKDLKKIIKSLNLENNIEFLGRIEHNNLDKYYRESLALLMPTLLFEGFGLVNIEAMKNKIPVIASNFGGVKDIVDHNKNGYLFRIGDYKELSFYMKKLYKNIELSERLGKNGFEKVKKEFNCEKYYKKLLKIYSNCNKTLND